MLNFLKQVIKEPTSYLGTGFVTVSLEAWANGNDTSATWALLFTGIMGIIMREKGTAK